MATELGTRKQMILKTAGFTAKVIGQLVPGVGVVDDLISLMLTRQGDRQAHRVLTLLTRLEERLEAEQAREVPPDLFEEVVAKAAVDEDNAKTNFYAGLIELVAREHPGSDEVRVLASVLGALTAAELRRLLSLGTDTRGDNLPGWLSKSFSSRLEGQGVLLPEKPMTLPIGHEDEQMARRLTPLGHRIVEVLKLGDQA
jgi:hypothetical protein